LQGKSHVLGVENQEREKRKIPHRQGISRGIDGDVGLGI